MRYVFSFYANTGGGASVPARIIHGRSHQDAARKALAAHMAKPRPAGERAAGGTLALRTATGAVVWQRRV